MLQYGHVAGGSHRVISDRESPEWGGQEAGAETLGFSKLSTSRGRWREGEARAHAGSAWGEFEEEGGERRH